MGSCRMTTGKRFEKEPKRQVRKKKKKPGSTAREAKERGIYCFRKRGKKGGTTLAAP